MNKSTYIIVGAIVVVLALIGYMVLGRSVGVTTPTTNSEHVENDVHTNADHRAPGAVHDDSGTAPHTD